MGELAAFLVCAFLFGFLVLAWAPEMRR